MSGNVAQEMTDWIAEAKKLLDISIGKVQGAKPTAGEFRGKMQEGIGIAAKPKPTEITPGDWAALQQCSAKIEQKLKSNNQIKKAIQQIEQKPDTTTIPSLLWDAVFSFWQEFDELSTDIENRKKAMADLAGKFGDPASFLEPKALDQLKQLDDPETIYGKASALELQVQALTKKLDAKKSAAYLIDVGGTKKELADITLLLKRLELGDAKDRLDTVGKTIDDTCKEIDTLNTFVKDLGGGPKAQQLAGQLGAADTSDMQAVFKALKRLNDARADRAKTEADLDGALKYAETIYTDKTNKDTKGKEQKKQQTLSLETNCRKWLQEWSNLAPEGQAGPAGKDLLGKVRDRITILNQGAPKSADQIAAERAARAKQDWIDFRSKMETAVNLYVGNGYSPAERGAFPAGALPQSVVTRCHDVPQFSVGGRPFFWSPSQTTPLVGAMHWEIPQAFWATGANGQLIRSFVYHLAPK